MRYIILLTILSAAENHLVSFAHAQLSPSVSQRLEQLEGEWLKETDASIRKKANARLEPLLLAVLSRQTANAARIIDTARREIARIDKSTLWMDSLQLAATKHVIDPGTENLTLTLNNIYPLEMPKSGNISITIKALQGTNVLATRSGTIKTIPHTEIIRFPSATGNIEITWDILANESPAIFLPHPVIQITAVPNLSNRLKQLSMRRELIDKLPRSIGRQTWLFQHAYICEIASGNKQPNGIDMDGLFRNLENASIDTVASSQWLHPNPLSSTLIVLPCKGGDKIVRVLFPANYKASTKPCPIIVALHGAGNSEDQFASGHARMIADRCSQNGWILVCPRGGIVSDMQWHLDSWLGTKNGPMALIGYSQGAAQALAFAANSPEQIRAVVALGGSGRAGYGAEYYQISMFLGIGSQDIGSKAVTNLATQLRAIGVRNVEFHRYDGIEHLMVVMAALDDTFNFLQKVMLPNNH